MTISHNFQHMQHVVVKYFRYPQSLLHWFQTSTKQTRKSSYNTTRLKAKM